MNDNECLAIILTAIKDMPKSNFGDENDEWANLASLGVKLKRDGINFESFGYNRLKDFISSFSPMLEVKTFTPPGKSARVAYVRISQDENCLTTKNLVTKDKSYPNALFKWAYMGNFETVLANLSKIALTEKWDFECSSKKAYPILRNYLIYTFERLQTENKVIYSENKQHAVFNTGLVNKLYSPIYALFEKNMIPNQQKWHFVNFAIEGEDRAGKMLVRNFVKLPSASEYFKNIADAFYDINMGKPILDTTHILIERAERMPIKFLKTYGPKNFDYKDYQLMTIEEKKKYASQLKESISNDIDSQRCMQSKIDAAVDLAIKRVQWNYKSAIPMYYPRGQKMCLLLPLCLVDEQIVDTALVVSKESSGRYQGQTIYLLDWAYKCARLVCRPDSDWLTVDNITATQDDIEQ